MSPRSAELIKELETLGKLCFALRKKARLYHSYPPDSPVRPIIHNELRLLAYAMEETHDILTKKP